MRFLMTLNDEEAIKIAEEYLCNTGSKFFYKCLGVNRFEDKKGILFILFLWSNTKDEFNIDGPIVVEIDEETGQVLERL